MSKKRTWSLTELIKAVEHSTSIRQVIISLRLKPTGGNYDQVYKYINEYSLSTDHFKGKAWNKGLRGIGKNIWKLEDILVRNSTYQSHKLKKRLFQAKLKTAQCELCGWAKRSLDGRVPVELDHINGDRHDNRLENLRILCPNCHSLQLTHRGLNRSR